MKIIILHIITFLLLLLAANTTNASTVNNVLNTFFFSQNDSTYIILHEGIFHPTSGSYEKGNLRAQGYNSSRISVYNMLNGKLIAQKDMGVMDSAEYCLTLGCSPNNLWLYSRKHKSGIQSLNPLTLKANVSQAKLYSTIEPNTGRFIDDKWQNIINNYGFNTIRQKLIVTNIDNKKYYIDINTFTTHEVTEQVDLNTHYNNYYSETVIYNDSVWELDGYKNMNLKCGSFVVDKPLFLYGRFILQQDTKQLYNHFLSIQDKLPEEALLGSRINNSKNNINNLLFGKKTDNILLQTDTNSLYILSKSSDKPDAFIEVSKLKSEQFGKFSTQWSTPVPGMFYNIAQARNTKKFKRYFGDITPEFDYQFFQIHNNKLVIIYLAYMCCIDIDNGNVIWRLKL